MRYILELLTHQSRAGERKEGWEGGLNPKNPKMLPWRHTCIGILERSASMSTDSSSTRVTSTVERHPTRFSQESRLKLGMRIMGTRASMLTATAKWKGREARTSAFRQCHLNASSVLSIC